MDAGHSLKTDHPRGPLRGTPFGGCLGLYAAVHVPDRVTEEVLISTAATSTQMRHSSVGMFSSGHESFAEDQLVARDIGQN